MPAFSAIKGHIVQAPSLGKVEITENGMLVLEGGRIIGVFPSLPPWYAGTPVTDYGDRLIFQSFADMHVHAPQYPMMGIGMDLPLLEWLNTYTFPVEAMFRDEDFARVSARQFAQALIRRGTTRACVFSSIYRRATLILMEELERAGVTGYVGKVNMDRNGSPEYQETTADSERETLRWLEECTQFHSVRPILTPRFTPTCTDALMTFLGRLAKEQGLYTQSHLSENKQEIEWVRELHPDCAQYWETYEKFGLFSDHTIMAHCVHSDERERAAMRQRHVLVAHCPDSNINIASGFVPLRKMLDEGLWVGLGSDVAGGARLSIPGTITSAIRMSKARRIASDWTEAFLTVDEGYYLGTSAGAQYFGAGAGFHPGDALHAVVVDDLAAFPANPRLSLHDRFERAIYLMDERSIMAVYSEGRQVL